MQPHINVIDMYHGNEANNMAFAAMKQAGLFAVIHKASQGPRYHDPKYTERRKAALDAGLLWGAYHFMISGNIDEQAESFLQASGVNDGNGPLLLACDYEDYSTQSQAAASLKECYRFMQIVDQNSPDGVQCVLYSGNRIRETLKPHTGGHQDQEMVGIESFFMSHRLWLAQYGPAVRVPWPWDQPVAKTGDQSTPMTPPGVWLWQFTEKGRFTPLRGLTDGNFYNGTFEQLQNDWLA